MRTRYISLRLNIQKYVLKQLEYITSSVLRASQVYAHSQVWVGSSMTWHQYMVGCLTPMYDINFQDKQMQVWHMSHRWRESDLAICPYNSQENKNPCLPFFCSSFTEDNQQSLISQETWQLDRVPLKNTFWNQNQVQPSSIAGTTS